MEFPLSEVRSSVNLHINQNEETMKANLYTHTIQPDDIDLTGLSTIPALYRKIINSIALNIRKEGYGIDVMAERGLSWVLARCGIEFRCRPGLYSELSIGVWKGKEDSCRHERNIEIRDENGRVIGCGITDWFVMNKKTRRPVVADMVSSLEAREIECDQPRRLRVIDSGKVFTGRAGYSECDFNGHLNNCSYVDKFFNLLPERITSLAGPLRLDINFKSEILCGADITASIQDNGDREFDFCLRQGDDVACLAALSLV